MFVYIYSFDINKKTGSIKLSDNYIINKIKLIENDDCCVLSLDKNLDVVIIELFSSHIAIDHLNKLALWLNLHPDKKLIINMVKYMASKIRTL